MSFLETPDGVRLRLCDRGGGGHTFVLVHGWKQSHRLFDAATAALSERHRVVAFDLRGMGESDKPRSRYDFAELAGDLAFVLETLDLADVTLVGWSMGCTVSLELLRGSAPRVGRLVLVNGPLRLTRTPDFPHALTDERLRGYLDDLARRWPRRERGFLADSLLDADPELVDWLLAVALQTPLDVALRLVREQARLDMRAVVERLAVPVLALWGRYDPYWPTGLADWIAEHAPRGERLVLERSAHCVPLEEPDRFCAALEDFAARTAAGGRPPGGGRSSGSTREKEVSMAEREADGGASPLLVQPGTEQELAPGVFVIPDRRVNLVPNVGIVLGDDAALVVDTAMGPANGERVLAEARRLGGSRRLYLTITHFHPEHGFGAQSFRDAATIVYNASQAAELAESGQEFVEMFSGFGPEIAELLAPVELVEPHETYEGERELDLGGRAVRLAELGGAHTRGDQIVHLPDDGVLFAGDLVENRFFPILFGDVANGPAWIERLDRLEALRPTTVVPGHGEPAGPELIRDLRDYLVRVRDEVAARATRGEDVEAIAAELGPAVRERYASWDNPEWIDFAIRNFHRELA